MSQVQGELSQKQTSYEFKVNPNGRYKIQNTIATIMYAEIIYVALIIPNHLDIGIESFDIFDFFHIYCHFISYDIQQSFCI